MEDLAVKKYRTILQRTGLAAFFFFLIKGLAWLAAPLLYIWLS